MRLSIVCQSVIADVGCVAIDHSAKRQSTGSVPGMTALVEDTLPIERAEDSWCRRFVLRSFLYYDSWRILCGLVKTLVYHTLGTLMPYPSEDPPRAGWFLPD